MKKKKEIKEELLSVMLLRLTAGDKFFFIIRGLRTSVYDFKVYVLPFLYFWHNP